MNEVEKLYATLKKSQEPKGYYFNKDKFASIFRFMRMVCFCKCKCRCQHYNQNLNCNFCFHDRLSQLLNVV